MPGTALTRLVPWWRYPTQCVNKLLNSFLRDRYYKEVEYQQSVSSAMRVVGQKLTSGASSWSRGRCELARLCSRSTDLRWQPRIYHHQLGYLSACSAWSMLCSRGVCCVRPAGHRQWVEECCKRQRTGRRPGLTMRPAESCCRVLHTCALTPADQIATEVAVAFRCAGPCAAYAER